MREFCMLCVLMCGKSGYSFLTFFEVLWVSCASDYNESFLCFSLCNVCTGHRYHTILCSSHSTVQVPVSAGRPGSEDR